MRFPSAIRNPILLQSFSLHLHRCKSMSELMQIHALLLTLGLSHRTQFTSKILSFSALSDPGNADHAFRFVSQIPNSTAFDWNTVIRGFSKNRNPNRAISVFIKMSRCGISPDGFTCLFLTKASASLRQLSLSQTVHSFILKRGFESDLFNRNTLIKMYACCSDFEASCKVFDEMSDRNFVTWSAILDSLVKSKDMESARKVFELMPERDVVAWSNLIDGYVKIGEYTEAFALFERMKSVDIRANEVTLLSLLCACTRLSDLERGRSLHSYAIKTGLPLTLELRTSMVDMYAKSGALNEASTLFHESLSQKTDVFIWNAMIGGLANLGFVEESLNLFNEMEAKGIVPDEITYLCLLSACAHGGLVTEAWRFFRCLENPKNEHYACLVDTLARSGRLDEVLGFVNEVVEKPTVEMWGSILRACVSYGAFEIAEIVGKKVVEIEPEHGGRYVGLSNVYAISERWEKAGSVRDDMDRRAVKKAAALSLML